MPDAEHPIPKWAELVPVWHLKWSPRRDAENPKYHPASYMTQERFELLIRQAQQQGYTLGEQQGRVNLRRGVENGSIEPIRPVKHA